MNFFSRWPNVSSMTQRSLSTNEALSICVYTCTHKLKKRHVDSKEYTMSSSMPMSNPCTTQKFPLDMFDGKVDGLVWNGIDETIRYCLQTL